MFRRYRLYFAIFIYVLLVPVVCRAYIPFIAEVVYKPNEPTHILFSGLDAFDAADAWNNKASYCWQKDRPTIHPATLISLSESTYLYEVGVDGSVVSSSCYISELIRSVMTSLSDKVIDLVKIVTQSDNQPPSDSSSSSASSETTDPKSQLAVKCTPDAGGTSDSSGGGGPSEVYRHSRSYVCMVCNGPCIERNLRIYPFPNEQKIAYLNQLDLRFREYLVWLGSILGGQSVSVSSWLALLRFYQQDGRDMGWLEGYREKAQATSGAAKLSDQAVEAASVLEGVGIASQSREIEPDAQRISLLHSSFQLFSQNQAEPVNKDDIEENWLGLLRHHWGQGYQQGWRSGYRSFSKQPDRQVNKVTNDQNRAERRSSPYQKPIQQSETRKPICHVSPQPRDSVIQHVPLLTSTVSSETERVENKGGSQYSDLPPRVRRYKPVGISPLAKNPGDWVKRGGEKK